MVCCSYCHDACCCVWYGWPDRVVDVSDNKLDDPSIVSIFEAMPNLKVLYLRGL
jgi:hypothetical protein